MTHRYNLVGTGGRARHYIRTLQNDHAAHADLVGMCDSNVPGMNAWVKRFGDPARHIALYDAADDGFERMIRDTRAATVLVLTPDHPHADYASRAMAGGGQVSEVTAEGLQALTLKKQAPTVTIPLTRIQEDKLLLIR